MKTVRVQATKNGSFHVTGPIEILDAEGNVMQSTQDAWLCRCGGSKNKPFCDGTHKTNGFQG